MGTSTGCCRAQRIIPIISATKWWSTEDNIVRHEEKLLLDALDISVPELVDLVRRHDGLVVPAHVEAPPFGLLVNLGMVPAELEGSPLEIACATPRERALRDFPPWPAIRCFATPTPISQGYRQGTHGILGSFPGAVPAAGGGGKPECSMSFARSPMVEDLCFHLVDLVQNSVAAGARVIRMQIRESRTRDSLELEVADDGRGMDGPTLLKVQDPFFTSEDFQKSRFGHPAAQGHHRDLPRQFRHR